MGCINVSQMYAKGDGVDKNPVAAKEYGEIAREMMDQLKEQQRIAFQEGSDQQTDLVVIETILHRECIKTEVFIVFRQNDKTIDTIEAIMMNASVIETEEIRGDSNMVNLFEKFRKWRLTGLGRALEEGTRQLR